MRCDLLLDIARFMGIISLGLVPAMLLMSAIVHEIDHMFWRTSRFPRPKSEEPKLLDYLVSGVLMVCAVELFFSVVVYFFPSGFMGYH